MTRSVLIERLISRFENLSCEAVDANVRFIFEEMLSNLEQDNRIEIRGFGCFDVVYRKPRIARNPKNGDLVKLDMKRAVHFKPGKKLRESINV